ncbi:hypothetical protein ACRW08_21840, partial [Escherichia coli]
MTDNISQSFFLRHPGNVTELRIDECIVRKYMESADRIQHSDSAVSVPFIKTGFAPIFPDTCYHLTHYWPAAADIPVASDNPVH